MTISKKTAELSETLQNLTQQEQELRIQAGLKPIKEETEPPAEGEQATNAESPAEGNATVEEVTPTENAAQVTESATPTVRKIPK